MWNIKLSRSEPKVLLPGFNRELAVYSFDRFSALAAPCRLSFPNLWDSQIAANLPREERIDVHMPRHRGKAFCERIPVYAVPAAFADKNTSLVKKVADEIRSLHTRENATAKSLLVREAFCREKHLLRAPRGLLQEQAAAPRADFLLPRARSCPAYLRPELLQSRRNTTCPFFF